MTINAIDDDVDVDDDDDDDDELIARAHCTETGP
jgi:hypothetical protein